MLISRIEIIWIQFLIQSMKPPITCVSNIYCSHKYAAEFLIMVGYVHGSELNDKINVYQSVSSSLWTCFVIKDGYVVRLQKTALYIDLY